MTCKAIELARPTAFPVDEVVAAGAAFMGTQKRKHLCTSSSATEELGADALAAELASAQVRLDELDAQLESMHALAALGTIAGMLAHEFNNILTPVVSYTQMALAQPDDLELSRKANERSLAACEQITRVAASILQFSKGTAGDPADVPRGTPAETACVHACIHRAIDCLGRDPQKDGISIEVECAPQLHARMRPDDLVHVLVNALLNAKAAMGRRRGRITVRARVAQDGLCANQFDASARLELAITDTGVGLSSEQLRCLFASESIDTPGDQASRPLGPRAGRRSTGGTGLGTLVMQRLVERAGGTIRAHSAVGIGTTIDIRVPRVPIQN